MAPLQSQPILSQLRGAKNFPEQTLALQALKNEIVGHIQKKELWIRLGVLQPIVKTLSTSRPPGKTNGRDARLQPLARPLSEEDAVKLQALQLVGSFANGGPSFLAPLHAARVLPAILANLSPYANAPQIVIATLRALTNVADASILAALPSPISVQDLADSLFQPQHIESLNCLFSLTSSKQYVQDQVKLAAGLISRLCRDERHQHVLASAGILDLLATRLASFAVSGGHVVPGAEHLAQDGGLAHVFPDPAPSNAKIGPILDAISAILGDSKYRAHRLLSSPSILAVFPAVYFEPATSSEDPRPDLQLNGSVDLRHKDATAMEYILPALPTARFKGLSGSQSPFTVPDHSDASGLSRGLLNRFSASNILRESQLAQGTANSRQDAEDLESPLIPWLIHLVRRRPDTERVAAAGVLTALCKLGLGCKGERETSLGLLVVPVLVDTIAKNSREAQDVDGPKEARRQVILERAPAVLARLITDSDFLQRAAFDCDAIKVIVKMLKRAYEPVETVNQPRYWSPHPDTDMEVESFLPAMQLGEEGRHPMVAHRVRVRESVLKAIRALAAGQEQYRKALVAEDCVPCILESLSESPRKPGRNKDKPREKLNLEEVEQPASPAYGANPVTVIIAACHVVRMMGRSVSILRTALVDNGIVLPVFRFLKHPNVNVQIAATACSINMLMEVSPLREVLQELGIMKILCEHAHSDNPMLRLNALWALKHLVDAVGPDFKKACLEELGSGWLVQLICDDTQDTALSNSRAGRLSESADNDADMQLVDEPFRWLYGADGNIQELDASASERLQEAEHKLASIREAELNPVRRARNDDVAIQEQGLDFIRNLIGRPGHGLQSDSVHETTEMIDHLFSVLGQDRLFEILASKLQYKVLNPFSRRTSTLGREPRIWPQAKIVVAVIYIFVHIAASIPRHKQLVIAQTEVLKLLAQQANNRDKEVKVALCHLVINLTWQEDASEAQACAERVRELKKLGYLAKMETLTKTDRDLDVRERAKTAVYQIGEVPATY